MTIQRYLGTAEEIKSLSKYLLNCQYLQKITTQTDKEAWDLALTLSEFEESFGKFLCDQLPNLIRHQKDKSKLDDLLLEIREELKHVLYHILDSDFFNSAYQELSDEVKSKIRQ